MKYALFTYDGSGFPIIDKLQDEGFEVVAGVIQDKNDTLTDIEPKQEEKPEEKKRRLKLYDGMVEKTTASELVDKLLNEKKKEEWFIFFDSNLCFKYAQQLMGKGFHGNFPTEDDRKFEVDRDMAKEFVNKHYGELKESEVHEFKKIDEAVSFLDEDEMLWVLKSYNPSGDTVVPDGDNIDFNHNQIKDALNNKKEEYESEGFILERFIKDAIEITPEITFYNGTPVLTTVNMEIKKFGAGNTGDMTGCSGDMVLPIDIDSPLSQISFPDIVYEMAKEHEGWFIWDASLYIDPIDDSVYFGEFCPNRVGYNSVFTQLALLDNKAEFFEQLIKEENPLENKIAKLATSVRIFNILKDKDRYPRPDLHISFDEDTYNDLWLFDVYKENDEYLTVGESREMGVVTGFGNGLKDATDKMYMYVDGVSYEGKYYRPQHDFLSSDYPGNISVRYKYLVEEKLI